jgi:hypothetical protein
MAAIIDGAPITNSDISYNTDSDRELDTTFGGLATGDSLTLIDYSLLTTITGAVGRPEFRDITQREFNNLANLSIKNKNRNDVDNEILNVALSDLFVNSLAFTNDVMVVKERDFEGIQSYNFLVNKKQDQIEKYLEYNYNMTTDAVDLVFNAIVNNLSRDISSSPPTSFTYDFKFSENQNGTILTGSVARRAPTRTTSGGGGGY